MTLQKTNITELEQGSEDTHTVSENSKNLYCALRDLPERVFTSDINPNRANLILLFGKKWVNGTVLHYHFLEQWATTEQEKDIVRAGFERWKNVGIGLTFKEVNSPDQAEIRIGFERGDGAWSYIGRDIIDLGLGRDERTMNFGWDLTKNPREIDTAIHEIGHTLGFPHEHQNPNAGIVWDEEAVYAELAKPPNRWPRPTTYNNIIRKINPDTVQGSNWDPDSVMHYPFEPGLIKEPAKYRNGLNPAGGLSERDKTWVKTFYPPLSDSDYVQLKPFESIKLILAPGEQKNFIIQPDSTRYYEIRTFGTSDTVMVLFEDNNGELSYLTGDDDSGEDRNAYIRIKLMTGRKYILRIRLYYASSIGETAVMMW
ncbi:hypothetical protein NUACC21_59640 [Scytonema sp. NUACC21]